MRIIDRSVYVGPSLYARFPVILLTLDLGALEGWPTARLGEDFIGGLAAALPGLAEHGCSYREPGGFYRRMRDGERADEVLAEARRGPAFEGTEIEREKDDREARVQRRADVHGTIDDAHGCCSS